MEKTIARVIITLDCPRKCLSCVNSYTHIMKEAKTISSMWELREYSGICITGGEPALDIDHVIRVVRQWRERKLSWGFAYLYSAFYREPWLDRVIEHFEGVHFTLHAKATRQDITDFEQFQIDAQVYANTKSFRLYIDRDNTRKVEIIPQVWSRVEVKGWLYGEECQLPAHEDLFILKTK